MSAHSSPKVSRRQLFIFAVVILVLVAVVPQLDSFRPAVKALEHAQISWASLGAVSAIISYGAAAAVYYCISPHQIRYRPTLLIQLATMFTNRLLPAGIGAAGLNFYYLRRQGCKAAMAAGTIAINNLLGIVCHLTVLLIAIGLFANQNRLDLELNGIQLGGIGVIVFAILITAVIIGRSKREHLLELRDQLGHQLRVYRRQPWRLLGGLLASFVVTACYTTVLYAAAKAVGVDLPLPTIFFVLTATVFGASITPTPGGIGGAEASLVAALVLYDVDPATALAIALLYRLLTFWLPLLAGIVAFAAARRQKYI